MEKLAVRTLSSTRTFSFKVIIPAVWISLFGVVTAMQWSGTLHGQNNEPLPKSFQYVFSIGWILGIIFFAWSCIGLKRVRMDGDMLYISNYDSEISTPVSNLSRITETLWINTTPITLHFKTATAYGDKITFMPAMRFAIWKSHPIVAELKHAAGLTEA